MKCCRKRRWAVSVGRTGRQCPEPGWTAPQNTQCPPVFRLCQDSTGSYLPLGPWMDPRGLEGIFLPYHLTWETLDVPQASHSHGSHLPLPSSYSGGTTSGLRPRPCPQAPLPSPPGTPQLALGHFEQAVLCSGLGFLIHKKRILGTSSNLVFTNGRVKTST